MSKQEVLPPIESGSLKAEGGQLPANVPSVHTGGIVSSALTRWHANASARALDARARLHASAAGLVAQHTALVESVIQHRYALYALQEQPERWTHELALRRVRRAEETRELQHTHQVNELRREREVTKAEAELVEAQAVLTHARTVLADAEQQLQAQKDHGYLHYEIEHKRKALERLDIELSEQERRALMGKHLRNLDQPEHSDIDDDEIDDALIARQQQLAAAGLDTTKVNAAIKARRAARERQAQD